MSYMPNYTYNPMNEKLVPKSAVVIDLPSLGFGDGERVAYCLRNHSSADCNLFGKLADLIEEQTKPPRIPEPGKYGVVRDELGEEWVRAGATQISSIEWMNVETGTRLDFDDIPNPKLVRIGIES